jgi:hypothetical protein
MPDKGMADRNSSIGTVLLVTGLVVAGLGFLGAQSIPIAGFGFALAIIGALILLLVPEVIPQDTYRALLKDSVTNIEIVLEESELKERAFFIPTRDGQVRAFIPLPNKARVAPDSVGSMSSGDAALTTLSHGTSASLGNYLLETLDNAPKRFITDYGGLQGLVLVPPGNEIVRLAKIGRVEGAHIENSLQRAIVSFSDLARSVLVASDEETGNLKIQMRGVRAFTETPYFNYCFGSLVSCVACCIVSYARKRPVRIVEEKSLDPSVVSLTLELIE